MTPDEEDFAERAAIVEEGNPGMTRAEAERIVRQWQQDRQRLPLVTPKIVVDNPNRFRLISRHGNDERLARTLLG